MWQTYGTLSGRSEANGQVGRHGASLPVDALRTGPLPDLQLAPQLGCGRGHASRATHGPRSLPLRPLVGVRVGVRVEVRVGFGFGFGVRLRLRARVRLTSGTAVIAREAAMEPPPPPQTPASAPAPLTPGAAPPRSQGQPPAPAPPKWAGGAGTASALPIARGGI